MAIKLRKALIIWLTLVTVLMVVYVGFGDKIRHKPSRMNWPEKALSAQSQATWETLSSCPLDSVSGASWLSALVTMNNDFPSQMISGPASYSPWMNVERIQQHGTLVLWQDDNDIVLPLLDEINVSDIRSTNYVDNTSNVIENNQTALVKQQGQWQIAWRDKAAEPLVINWIAYVPSSCFKSPY